MTDSSDHRWRGLRAGARRQLKQRDYAPAPEQAAIPGVELLPRAIYQQDGRGFFGELTRLSEGRLSEIGLRPLQWSSARMFAGSAKGFHVHPPAIPADAEPSTWFRRLFVDEAENYALRPYADEQWDVMFFLQGRAQVLLVDERDGLERRVMRFFIDGDDLPGGHNVGIVIPPGVAHAIRSASSSDLVMVYGTSTVFDPLAEGRIASELESHALPPDWQAYVDGES